MGNDVRILGADGQPLAPSARALGKSIGGGYRAALQGSFYDGASQFDSDLASWNPLNVSAQTAITLERDAIASRIHDAVRNDGWASAAVQRPIDAMVGGGWRRSSKPNAKLLGIDPKAATELGYDIDAHWKSYCEDFESCDAGQRHNMGAILALALRQRLVDGETLSLSLWLNRGQAWKTAIQLISPDRLSNPNLYLDSVDQRSGVKLGRWNEPLAYSIRSAHPGDYAVLRAYPWIWEQLPRKYKNGRWCVVHAFEASDCNQVRGISPLAPILKKLHMLGKYDHAELQAATINALLAAFIKSDGDHEEIARALQGADSDTLTAYEDRRLGFYEGNRVALPGAKLNFLYTGDSVELTKAGHPNTAFEGYYRTGMRYLAAAANVSYEQLTGDYSQVNYASQRAAMLEIWRGFTARKTHFAAGFMDPHFSNWLEEAIETGRVKPPKGAPRFRDARAAYCAGAWRGPPRGWVDPIKEADAAIARISAGLSTLEMECAEQGHDWRELIMQRAAERQFMIENGIDPDSLLRSKLPRNDQPGDEPPPPPAQQKPKPTGQPDDGDDD